MPPDGYGRPGPSYDPGGLALGPPVLRGAPAPPRAYRPRAGPRSRAPAEGRDRPAAHGRDLGGRPRSRRPLAGRAPEARRRAAIPALLWNQGERPGESPAPVLRAAAHASAGGAGRAHPPRPFPCIETFVCKRLGPGRGPHARDTGAARAQEPANDLHLSRPRRPGPAREDGGAG